MGRLTWKKPNGDWGINGVEFSEVRPAYGALCKLLAYENTGLSPDEVERLRDDLEEQQEGYCWIPVEERLPEGMEIVPITVSRGYVTYGYYDPEKQEWWHHDDSGLMEVIAWMPLPEPYEKEEI